MSLNWDFDAFFSSEFKYFISVWVCVSVFCTCILVVRVCCNGLWYTAQKVSLEFISSGPVATRAPLMNRELLPLLLKLKTQRDLHGNESVSWSLTRLQMDRKQISISSFNPLMCFVFRSSCGGGMGGGWWRWWGGRGCPLWPNKPFVERIIVMIMKH